MKLRRTKNGRIKDMDTGLFVNKKLAKSFANGKKIPLLKSTKRSKSYDAKKINHPKYRATKILRIKEYKNGDYHFPSMDDYEELFIGNCMILDAQHDIKENIYHNEEKK